MGWDGEGRRESVGNGVGLGHFEDQKLGGSPTE
jgi:hypothetical protein